MYRGIHFLLIFHPKHRLRVLAKNCLVIIIILLASGMMALAGSAIRGEVYSWVAVVILPITSSVNPLIYTLLAALQKKVVSVFTANA